MAQQSLKHAVIEASLEFLIVGPSPSTFWGHRQMLPHIGKVNYFTVIIKLNFIVNIYLKCKN